MINPLEQRIWINNIELTDGFTARIRQEFPPFSTTATLIIGYDSFGGPIERAILDSQVKNRRVTLAHTHKDSVLIARNLQVVKYSSDFAPNDALVEIDFRGGDALQIVPIDEFLATLKNAA